MPVCGCVCVFSTEKIAYEMKSMLVLSRQLARTRPVPIHAGNYVVRCYHDVVIDHYENPRNVGSLDKNKKSVGEYGYTKVG
jgi:hypothetical protein